MTERERERENRGGRNLKLLQMAGAMNAFCYRQGGVRQQHGIAKMLTTQTRPDTLLRFGRIRCVLYFHPTRKLGGGWL